MASGSMIDVLLFMSRLKKVFIPHKITHMNPAANQIRSNKGL